MKERNYRLLSPARVLRKNLTKEERHLWYDFLREFPVRFRRQEIIGSYIADFYCVKAKLVVELDGSQHYNQETMNTDARRTTYFESLGIDVLRFPNLDIWRNFEGVCFTITQKVNERTDQH